MIKEKETKHEAFVRVANSRVNKILTMIYSLGKLSNRVTYDYNETEVEKIFKALNGGLEDCRRKFESPQRGLFKLVEEEKGGMNHGCNVSEDGKME